MEGIKNRDSDVVGERRKETEEKKVIVELKLEVGGIEQEKSESEKQRYLFEDD
jgi:hypothetical protein